MKRETISGAFIIHAVLASCIVMSLLGATPPSLPKQSDPDRLILICHNDQPTLIKLSSWQMHRSHGDMLGSCISQPTGVGTEAYRKNK